MSFLPQRHEVSKTLKGKLFVTWCLGDFVVSLRIGSKLDFIHLSSFFYANVKVKNGFLQLL